VAKSVCEVEEGQKQGEEGEQRVIGGEWSSGDRGDGEEVSSGGSISRKGSGGRAKARVFQGWYQSHDNG